MPGGGFRADPKSKRLGVMSPSILKRAPGGGGGSSYWPTDSDFVEVWRYSMASNGLVGRNLGDSYPKTGTGGSYEQAGPAGTDLVAYAHASEYFVDTSLNPALNPGTSSFSISFVTKNGVNSDWCLFDLDCAIGTTEGIYVAKIGTTFYMLAHDGTNGHQSEWTDANGGTALEDGNWHHVKIIADRSLTKFNLELDGVSQTTTKTGGANLNTLGAIEPTGGIALSGQENNGGRRMNNGHLISYVAFAHNITANTPQLP